MVIVDQKDTVYMLTLKTIRSYDNSLKRIITEEDIFDENYNYKENVSQYLEPTQN